MFINKLRKQIIKTRHLHKSHHHGGKTSCLVHRCRKRPWYVERIMTYTAPAGEVRSFRKNTVQGELNMLGGGFNGFVWNTPIWGRFPIFTYSFSNWLKLPNRIFFMMWSSWSIGWSWSLASRTREPFRNSQPTEYWIYICIYQLLKLYIYTYLYLDTCASGDEFSKILCSSHISPEGVGTVL